ncbi:MAG: Smr/MutS family protein [Myxococcales bacterium]|nr:Smr/MutS family protein [Myxococcales bacterium]
MAQLKKRSKTSASPPKEPKLNSPFFEARKELWELYDQSKQVQVRKEPPPPPPVIAEEEKLSDSELFYREMQGIRRIASQGRDRPVEMERAARQRLSEDAEAYAQLSDLLSGTGSFDISDTDEYIEGIAHGLDRRLLVRLRRGDFSIQAHVDLHGLNREEARIRVETFLHESRTNDRRCVLIVHGRGLNSKDQIPVLKEAVRLWLVRGRISKSVLAFATARPTDGGAGAVYVLLRR